LADRGTQPDAARVSTTGRLELRQVIALSVVWAIGAALYLMLPPGPDQSNHAYMGWRLLQGDVPYVDYIDQNWPGVMGLHALAGALFGQQLWSWRAFDLLLFAAAAAALWDILRRGAGAQAARAFAWTALPAYVASGYWVAGQHDMTAAQLLAIGLWCHVRGAVARPWRWHTAAGVFIGLAMLNKPTMGAALALLPLQGLLLGARWTEVAVRLAVTSAATAATVAGGFLFVVALGATLAQVVESVLTYNTYSLAEGTPPLADIVRTTGAWPVVLAFVCLPAIVFLLRRARRSVASTMPFVLWAVGAISYAFQARGFSYHLAPAVLAYFCLAAVLLALAGRALGNPTWPAWQRAGVVMLAAVFVAGIGARFWSAFHRLPAALAQRDYDLHLARFTENDGLNVGEAAAFARRAGVGAPGCIFVAGESSVVNLLARRPLPTRFYYFPVIGSARPPLPMAERWVTQWEVDLRRARCPYVLVHPRCWALGDAPHALRVAGALRELLARYRETGRLGRDLVVYEPR
jgi:hypothetical protein